MATIESVASGNFMHDGSYVDVINKRANLLHRFTNISGSVRVDVCTLDYYDVTEERIEREERAMTYFVNSEFARKLYDLVLDATNDMN